MPNKVIFTSEIHKLTESKLFPQKLQQRQRHPHQLKLKDLSMTQQELQAWFCELSLNKVNIKNLNLQFPKKNPFANPNIPDDEEGRIFKDKFDAAKADFLKSSNPDAQILMYVDVILENKLRNWSEYSNTYDREIIRFYNNLKNFNLWQIPLIQQNQKILFEGMADDLPLFLEKLQSIGALNQDTLEKATSLSTLDWRGRVLSPVFNDQNLWQMLRKMPQEDAQRLFQKMMNSPDPKAIIEIILKLMVNQKDNIADCEKWVDGILKINNIKNYLHLLDSYLIQGVKFWELSNPENYLQLMSRVKACNERKRDQFDEIYPNWINRHDPEVFPVYEKLSRMYASKIWELSLVFTQYFFTAQIPKDFEAHMDNMKNPAGVILYLDFIRVCDLDKYSQLCENLDNVSEIMEADEQYKRIHYSERTLIILKQYPEVLSFLYQLENPELYFDLMSSSGMLNNLKNYYPLLQENKELLPAILPLLNNQNFEQKLEKLKTLKLKNGLVLELSDFFLRNSYDKQKINALYESPIFASLGELSEESREKVFSGKYPPEAFKLLNQLASNQQITNIENCVRHIFDEKNSKSVAMIQQYALSDASFLNQPNIDQYLNFLKIIDGYRSRMWTDPFQALVQLITKLPVEKLSTYENFLKVLGVHEGQKMLVDYKMMEHPIGQYFLEHPTPRIDFEEAKKYFQLMTVLYPENANQSIETLLKNMSSDKQFKWVSNLQGIFQNPRMLKFCYESSEPPLLWSFYSQHKDIPGWNDFILKRPDCIPQIAQILGGRRGESLRDSLLSLVVTLEEHHLLTPNFLKALLKNQDSFAMDTIAKSSAWKRIADLPLEEAQQIMSKLENSKSILTALDIINGAPADRNLVELMQKFSNEDMERWQIIHNYYPNLLKEMNVLQHPQPEIAFALLNLMLEWKRQNYYDDTPLIIKCLKSKSYEELQGWHQLVQKSNFNELNANLEFYESSMGQQIIKGIDNIKQPVQTRQYIQYIQNVHPERVDDVMTDLGSIDEKAKKDDSYVKYQALMAHLQNDRQFLSQFNLKSLLTYPNPVAVFELVITLHFQTRTPIKELYAMIEQNREMSEWQHLMKSNVLRELINGYNVRSILTEIRDDTIALINHTDANRVKSIFNSYFKPDVLQNLFKLQNHSKLLEKLDKNKILYDVFYLAMSDKNVDFKAWQAFIDVNMPMDFLKECTPLIIQTIGSHVGWYVDVSQSSNPGLLLHFASFIPSYKNRREMIEKLEQHPDLTKLYQYMDFFKREPLLLDRHLMEILDEPNSHQMKELIENLMKRKLPLSFAYESAKVLIQGNNNISIDAYCGLYQKFYYAADKVNEGFASGMIHLLQMDMADKLVPLLSQIWGRELMLHLEDVGQLNRDAEILKLFPGILIDSFRVVSTLHNIDKLLNLPHREEFSQVLCRMNRFDSRLESILSVDHLSERAELIHLIQSISPNASSLQNSIISMRNAHEFYGAITALPQEQQHMLINVLNTWDFFRLQNADAIMSYIISSPNPLQNIGVLNNFLKALGRDINAQYFRMFQQFMEKFKDEDVDQLSRDLALFGQKTNAFGAVMMLIDSGFRVDASLLRHIGQHPQPEYLDRLIHILHDYKLLVGEKYEKNISFLLGHDDLVGLYSQIESMCLKRQLTQENLEKIFYNNKLSEKTHDPFIGVDANNQVHIYMPLTNGVEICTDNTCKSAEALRASMGYINGQQSIELSIKEYIADLKKDIALLRPESKLCRQKEERVKQLENYQSSFNDVKCLPDIQSLSSIYPEYPDGMKAIMCRPDANLSSMQLSPRIMDGYLRMVNPTFSLRIIDREAIEPLLRDVLSKMDFPPEASRETFIQLVLSKLTEPKVRLTDFEELLSRETENEFGYPIKYEIEQFTPALRATLNEMTFPPSDIRAPFIQGILRQVEAEPEMSYERLQDILTAQTELTFGEKVNYRGVTIQSIYDIMGDDTLDVNNDAGTFVEALLGFAAPELFNMAPRGPFQQRFDGSQEEDRLSITVQFYLAEINMYCHQHDISHQNFGLLLQNTDLRTAFLECLRGCTLETIEHRLFEFVSQHHAAFELSRPLDMNDFKVIQRDFYVHFSSVMGSPHYDEFSVLNFEKNGGFYSHGGKICVDYLDYLKEAIPNHTLNQDAQMQEILAQSKQLPVNTFHPVEKIKDLSLEEKKERVEQGYPLGFLLGELNESQQVELLSDFGKFALYILEGSRPEMQNLNGNIAPAALSYLQDLSIAHDKPNMFKLNAEQMACRDTLERLSQAYPEESNWLRALLIRDANLVSRGLEHFPSMPSKFIDAVFGQKTLLARINHVLEERDAPPLKKPEDLAAYRNVTADFKDQLRKNNPNPDDEESQYLGHKRP